MSDEIIKFEESKELYSKIVDLITARVAVIWYIICCGN
jgi:hypothetical protein